MISDHINDIITAAKAMPNGLNRNKMVSHLEDAKAHAIVLEGYTIAPVHKFKQQVTQEELRNSLIGENPFCICHDGTIDTACPVHSPKPL